jgi:hypothetical protein
MPDGTVVVGTNGVPPTNQFVVSSNGVPGATGQFTFNPNRFNFPLSRTNDAGVAATRPAVFQDSAATREDQVLLIQLRRSISTELQAVATTTAPGGNTITPPVHLVINNGVVRVVGTVPAANTRERILMLVQRSPGVTQVVDELQVNATGMTDASVTSASAAGAQNVGTANQTALTAGANGVTNNLPPTSMRTNSSVFANTNQFHHGPILPPTSRTGLPPGLQDRPLPPGLEMQRTNGTPNNP